MIYGNVYILNDFSGFQSHPIDSTVHSGINIIDENCDKTNKNDCIAIIVVSVVTYNNS